MRGDFLLKKNTRKDTKPGVFYVGSCCFMAHSEFSCFAFSWRSLFSWASRKDSAIFLRWASRSFMLARRLIVRLIFFRRLHFLAIIYLLIIKILFISLSIVKMRSSVEGSLRICLRLKLHFLISTSFFLILYFLSIIIEKRYLNVK